MTNTIHLGMPFIEGSQAQKHVTHNEALRILDAVVQIGVLDRDRAAPPLTPLGIERTNLTPRVRQTGWLPALIAATPKVRFLSTARPRERPHPTRRRQIAHQLPLIRPALDWNNRQMPRGHRLMCHLLNSHNTPEQEIRLHFSPVHRWSQHPTQHRSILT